MSSGPSSKTFLHTFVDKKTGLSVKIIISKPKYPLEARISEISMKGLMTVQFSDKISKPANYTMFNEEFLKIRIIKSEDTKPTENKTLIDWKIVAFRAKEMDIQLNFSDPIVISSGMVSIKYLNNINSLKIKLN